MKTSTNAARTRTRIVQKVRRRNTTKEAFTLTSLFPEYRSESYAERLQEQRNGFINSLREAYLHRGLVLYVGAGVSRSIGLPSWQELVRALTVNMMTRKVKSAVESVGELNPEDYWERTRGVYEELESASGVDKPILMMARAIKTQLGNDLPATVARILYRAVWKYFREPFRPMIVRKVGRRVERIPAKVADPNLPSRFPRSALLDALVSLARSERDVRGVQAIVNYNYDDILDEALRANNVRCKTVRSGHDKLPYGTLPCYHVHGVLPVRDFFKKGRSLSDRDVGNFVFSEDEYHAEYASPFKWSNMTQMSLLGRYTGLFVGLSMEDPNIRRLIDATHQQYPDIVNYAILSRPRNDSDGNKSTRKVLKNLFEDVETGSFERIGVKVIWVNDHSEVPTVISQICQLEAAGDQSDKPCSPRPMRLPMLPGQTRSAK